VLGCAGRDAVGNAAGLLDESNIKITAMIGTGLIAIPMAEGQNVANE
jgi:hypothetical protein